MIEITDDETVHVTLNIEGDEIAQAIYDVNDNVNTKAGEIDSTKNIIDGIKQDIDLIKADVDIKLGEITNIMNAVDASTQATQQALNDTILAKNELLSQKDQEGGIALFDESIIQCELLELIPTTQRRGRNSMFVKDKERGGYFTFIPSSENLIIDNGIVFGAVGGGYWVRQYSGKVNVKWFGAKGDGVTDDTLAIKNAIKYVIDQSFVGLVGGFRLGLPEIFFPSGHFVTSGKNLFGSTATSFGAISGLNFRGNGMRSTYITFTSDNDDPDNFAFLVNNNYAYLEFNDLAFRGASGKESFMKLTGIGTAQSYRFICCEWRNMKMGFDIGQTLGIDSFHFDRCKVRLMYDNFIYTHDNENILNINLYSTDIELCFADIFNIRSGGDINFFSGSVIPSGEAYIINIDGPISLINSQTTPFNFYGMRVEFRDTSKLIRINADTHVNFNGCHFGGVSNPGQQHIEHFRGRINITKSVMNIKIRTNNVDNQTEITNLINIEDTVFENTDFITQELTGNQLFKSALTKINIRNCYYRTANLSRGALDVYQNARYGYNKSEPTEKVHFITASVNSTLGLPNNTAVTRKLPLNCVIKKIVIYKNTSTAGGNIFYYKVKNHDGTIIFAQLDCAGIDTCIEESEISYTIDTELKRSIVFENTGFNAFQDGYLAIHYV